MVIIIITHSTVIIGINIIVILTRLRASAIQRLDLDATHAKQLGRQGQDPDVAWPLLKLGGFPQLGLPFWGSR